ncbi:MAG: hypothetical protein Fur0043_12250 [Anaerolineales bacterium]
MYIDPNTGGMLFQVLAVAFAAVSGMFLVFSRQIRTAMGRLRRRFGGKQTEDASTKEKQEQ